MVGKSAVCLERKGAAYPGEESPLATGLSATSNEPRVLKCLFCSSSRRPYSHPFNGRCSLATAGISLLLFVPFDRPRSTCLLLSNPNAIVQADGKVESCSWVIWRSRQNAVPPIDQVERKQDKRPTILFWMAVVLDRLCTKAATDRDTGVKLTRLPRCLRMGNERRSPPSSPSISCRFWSSRGGSGRPGTRPRSSADPWTRSQSCSYLSEMHPGQSLPSELLFLVFACEWIPQDASSGGALLLDGRYRLHRPQQGSHSVSRRSACLLGCLCVSLPVCRLPAQRRRASFALGLRESCCLPGFPFLAPLLSLVRMLGQFMYKRTGQDGVAAHLDGGNQATPIQGERANKASLAGGAAIRATWDWIHGHEPSHCLASNEPNRFDSTRSAGGGLIDIREHKRAHRPSANVVSDRRQQGQSVCDEIDRSSLETGRSGDVTCCRLIEPVDRVVRADEPWPGERQLGTNACDEPPLQGRHASR
ncbi:uncharacterized protein BJ171DRAFT_196972 [Polychytrium aggregatum]|uniref:uncharacterized protein n=1 Tax=Polychytrium aggregatum TaxID=110093 RepID=UPI0022FDC7B8|nr:uncharacterized protein BJ171DRAFT_196972 [Polychytrium aggregatum]KAI9201875.1 hypothetical protein BJ171DRAFT_196972 [Polychytrium aggregatum]